MGALETEILKISESQDFTIKIIIAVLKGSYDAFF